jgi:hypothetical protein
VGASGWDYHVAYTDDPQQMLASLHSTVLAEQSYYWANEDVPRPTTLAQLHELYEDDDNEDLASEGTHSILDGVVALIDWGQRCSPDGPMAAVIGIAQARRTRPGRDHARARRR